MYSKKALQYAQVFVDGDIVEPDKIELVARNIQQIMLNMQNKAVEEAAVICETMQTGNWEAVAKAIRALAPPS